MLWFLLLPVDPSAERIFCISVQNISSRVSYVFAGTLYFPIRPGSDTKDASYFKVKNNWKPILRSQ